MMVTERHKKTTKLVAILSGVGILMFAFAFALVPIYNTLCKSLGINGRVTQASSKEIPTQAHLNRTIDVEFIATKNGGIPWEFYPKVSHISVHPGEIAKLSFYAENQSAYKMTVQAIPSITPGIAAKYIKKTECFCFEHQTLNSHEAMDMPLLFHVDSDLPPEIHTITLSYTLFDVTHRVQKQGA